MNGRFVAVSKYPQYETQRQQQVFSDLNLFMTRAAAWG